MHSGVLQPKKWENCMTLDKYAWSFRKNTNFEDYLTPEELITTIGIYLFIYIFT